MALRDEMERIGRLIAFDRNLKVDVQGTRAYATPGRIVIPNEETFALLGGDSARLLQGMLDHECGHARFTDFTWGKKAQEEGGARLRALFNAIEDARIEALMSREFIGCAQNLRRNNRWFWEKHRNLPLKKRSDLWFDFTVVVIVLLRGAASREEVEAFNSKILPLVDYAFQNGLDRVSELSSTEDAFNLALELWKLMSDDSGDSSKSEDKEDEESNDKNKSKGNAGESQAGNSLPADSSDAEKQPSGGDESPSSPEESKAGAPTPQQQKLLKALHKQLERPSWEVDPSTLSPEEMLSSLLDEREGDSVYQNFSHEYDLTRNFFEDPPNVAVRREFASDSIEAMAKDAAFAASDLTHVFEVALRARKLKHPVGGNDEGEVDLDLLGEFAVGALPSDVIFQQWVAEDAKDVAVAILLDCSGSMRSKEHLTRRVSYAIHSALLSCGIDHEISGFSTVQSDGTHPWFSRQELSEHFSRMRKALLEGVEHGVNPLLFARELYRYREAEKGPKEELTEICKQATLSAPAHVIFKPFGVSDASGLRFAVGDGENLDGEALLWQARRLHRRPEKRRVMFVLSDGEPNGARWHKLEQQYLKDSIQRIRESGIEIYGIGIGDSAVSNYYPRYWIAKTLPSLMETALGSMIEVLTSDRIENA